MESDKTSLSCPECFPVQATLYSQTNKTFKLYRSIQIVESFNTGLIKCANQLLWKADTFYYIIFMFL